MEEKYYPLHVHTSVGSVGDSILGISEYVKKAKEYNLKALAITDHGSMSAMYTFVDACEKNDIKPIIGMEAYVVDDNNVEHQKEEKYKKGTASHLVLLAKNNQGFENLLRIHNQAATEGYYYEARTDWEHLLKWGKGIIAFSACVGGEIPRAILSDNLQRAEDLIGLYHECFDEFYLELQPGNFEEQIKVNHTLVKLAREKEIPLIVTNDIHYLTEKDAIRHDYHVKLGRKCNVSKNDDLIYPDTVYWFMDTDALKDSFQYDDILTEDILTGAIKNTMNVANTCDVNFNDKIHMPKFPIDNGETEEEKLYRLCYDKLAKIIEDKSNPQEYMDRLEYELKVIEEKGFCGYFLIVADYVNWAKENGIPVGPGRGSAAGSLVTYLLGICQADPITYGLLFERFLDPHRESIPDIDIDFAPGENGRDRMLQYAVEKYGKDCCALVSTITMRKARGAIHDAARILGYPPALGNEIAKFVPMVFYGEEGEKQTDLDIDTSLRNIPELKKYQEKYPDIFKLAMSLEGLPSTKGIHAAGMIISPVSLKTKIPLVKSNKEDVLATSLTLGDAEKSFVKFDFLSVSNLEIIKNTENNINWSFDFQDESLYQDEDVWNLIGSSNTTGLFQIASKTYRDRMYRLKPKTIKELAACLALVRGPAISANTDELYMRIVEGKEEVRLVHPIYDEITKDTNGILIYQEQIMHLAVAFGMDLSTGYRIVKASAKKKIAQLETYRQQFLKNAAEKDCDEKTANIIFDMIVESGLYSFNLSHAVSYALLTYASAYLKVHYPIEFMSNLLTYTYENSKEKEYGMVLKDCRKQNIEFLPADINKSAWKFTVEDGKIRIGLCAVKGLGEKAADTFMLLKENKFKNIEDLMKLINELKIGKTFNKKIMSVSIFSGLLDSILEEKTRYDLYEEYLTARKEEMPDFIKLGVKNFEFDPVITTKRELEKMFFHNSFIERTAG